MREYKLQIMRTCIQTYFNLYGIMPGTQELREMLGESFDDVIPMALYTEDNKVA